MSIDTARNVDPHHSELVRMFHSGTHGLKLGFTAGLRNGTPNHGIRSVFFYSSGWLAGRRIAHDLASWRIRCVSCDVCGLQRFAVGPPRMPVVAFQIHRATGEDRIKIRFVRKSRGSKDGIRPAASEHPEILRMRVGIYLHPLYDLVDGLGIIEVDLLQGE